MQYDLVVAGNHTDLVKFVNSKLKDGWELHGNTTMATSGTFIHFHQAVVKKDPTISINEK